MIVVYVGSIVAGIVLIGTAMVMFFASNPGVEDPAGQFFGLLWLRFITLPLGAGLVAWGGNGIRRSKHAKATEKTRTADEELRVYESTDSHSPLIATLPEGSGIELGSVTETNGVDWIGVKLPDGRQGYALGHAHVHTMIRGVIEKETPMYDFPDLASPSVGQLPSGTEIEIVKGDWDSAPYDQAVGVRAWLTDERKTHIKSTSKLRWL